MNLGNYAVKVKVSIRILTIFR